MWVDRMTVNACTTRRNEPSLFSLPSIFFPNLYVVWMYFPRNGSCMDRITILWIDREMPSFDRTFYYHRIFLVYHTLHFTSNDSFFDRQFLLHHRQFHRQFHLTPSIFLLFNAKVSSCRRPTASFLLRASFFCSKTNDFLPIDGPTVSSSTWVTWFLPFEWRVLVYSFSID